MRNRRTLIFSAAAVVAVWLLAVVAFTLRQYPGFWRRPEIQFEDAQQLAARGRNAQALSAIQAALTRVPDNPHYLTFRGYRELEAQDAAAAEGSFRRALDQSSSNADARLGLAEALRREHHRDDALRVLDGMNVDGDAARLRRRSQLYGELEAPASALQDLGLLLRTRTDDPELLKESVVHARSLRDWARVTSLSERLLAAAPDAATRQWAGDARAQAMAMAMPPAPPPPPAPPDPFALLAAGHRAEAEREFRQRLAADPDDLKMVAAYTWFLNTGHRYDEAWLVVARLPRPSSDLPILELQTRTAIWAGRADAAVPLANAWLGHRPLDADVLKDLAELLDRNGDRQGAADAYRRYLQLRSQDARGRQALAALLISTGSLDAAIAELKVLVAQAPSTPGAWSRLGLAQESAGELADARSSYLQAVALETAPSADLVLRLARVSRWLADLPAAIEWYRRYLHDVADPVVSQTARRELALSLLDAGRPLDSLDQLRGAEQVAPLTADDLVLAARAATASNQPAIAARYLQQLAAMRPLTPDEQRWLAGQYRASGDVAAALRLYETLAASSEADALEAVADLRFDFGDYAGALAALRRIGGRRPVDLKLARTAARAGVSGEAAAAYARVVARTADVAARLEAARYLASAGRSRDALQQYRAVIAQRGADGLRTEIARAALASQEFADAESWARQALAAGEDPADAALALAQSLHLQGRSKEARAILGPLAAASPPVSDALTWQGQVAVALDRHLEAYRAFDAAMDAAGAGSDAGDRLALWAGTEAQKRGDYGRALRHFETAAAPGPALPQAQAALRTLAVEAAPRVYVPIWGHGDTNGLRIAQAGFGLSVPLPRLLGVLTISGSRGTVSQRSFDDRLNSAAIDLAHLFVSPALELAGRASLSRFDRGATLLAWNAAATLWVSDDVRLGVSQSRAPILPFGLPETLRQFNRVLDVSAIGPAFYSDGIRALADVSMHSDGIHVDAGHERFQDGNRQTYAYGQLQIPLASSARTWAVIRPNAFLESFRDSNTAYFSPATHMTLGTMLHAIRQYRRMDVEVELNPQLLRTDGATGVGGHGLFNLVIKAGGARLTAGTFVFYDSLKDYTQWRFAVGAIFPIGR